MRIKPGQTAILTGAAGGIGSFLATAIAEKRVNLALVDRPGVDLTRLCSRLGEFNIAATAFPLDLRDPSALPGLVKEVAQEFGGIDFLVNNAGIEMTSPYHELAERGIKEMLQVNLEAPMLLSRLALIEMLKRGQGHIINMSSLAGKVGPAFQETYAATKAALISFTLALRSSYRAHGVSASVITPGFVEAGIYSRLKDKVGNGPALAGASTPDKIARAMIKAIEQDKPEIIVNPLPVRPILAFAALFPSVGERLVHRFGLNEFFRRVTEHDKPSAKVQPKTGG
jgi:short-subunit dehydrogenase